MTGHSSEKRWRDQQTNDSGVGVSTTVSNAVVTVIEGLSNAEIMFQDLAELFVFVGATDQLLADQLFFEDWSTRLIPGIQTVITVDVVAGVVGNLIIATAGAGYIDGIGFVISLGSTAGGGDGLAQITYDVVSGSVTNATISAVGSIYNNGLGITVLEISVPDRNNFETQASAIEVSKAQDLIGAVTAMHELYLAGNNVAVAQEDRFSQLRRMS